MTLACHTGSRAPHLARVTRDARPEDTETCEDELPGTEYAVARINMTTTTRYRVNFGAGQVWYFNTRKACADYITEARRDARDPYTALYFIERKDPETGDWFRSRDRGNGK